MAKTLPEDKVNSVQKIDEELLNGPVDKRQCNDILCCLLFLAHALAMAGVFIWAVTQGNPIYLTGFCAGKYTNSTTVTECAMFCGAGSPNNSAISGSAKDYYKYLYYPAPFNADDILNGKGVCVSECPNATLGLDVMGKDSKGNEKCLYNDTFYNSCGKTASQYAADIQAKSQASGTNATSIVTNFKSYSLSTLKDMFLVYKSSPFLNRLCVPSDPAILENSYVKQAIDQLSSLSQHIYDVYNAYQAILITTGAALVFAYLYMIFLRFCSGVIIWLMILLNLLVLGALGYFFYDRGTLNPPADATSDTNTQNTNIAYAIWGIDGAFALFILCMYNRIKLAIAILKTATMFTRDVKSALIVPIFFCVQLVLLFGFWLIGFIYIYAIGTVQKSIYGPVAAFSGGTATYQSNSIDSRYVLAWWIFAGLWKNAFLGALQQFVLASSVALWYFGQGQAHAPVARSYYRAFRYHWGSLAFGSLILAIVQFIRLVLTYIQKKINENPNLKDNPLIKVLMCCLQCYFWCLEKCIKFLNKNAYIQMAIQGKSFCGSAKDAFFIILKNPARIAAVAGFGGMFIALGKLIISGAATLGGYLLITRTEKFSQNLISPVLPTVFMFFISWGIALLVMSVYGMAADTILHCFLIDEQLNKEKGRPPSFTPEPLQEFLEKVENQNKTS